MKILLMLSLLLVTPLLALAQDEPARRAAGCGPNEIEYDVKTDKKQHPKGTLEDGKALVYIFDGRGELCVGCLRARVGVDGVWMGANLKASYFFFPVAPGTHNICTSGKSPFAKATNASLVATTFTAEPGQTYYFLITFHEDSGYIFHPVTPAQSELYISQLPFSTFSVKPQKPSAH